MKIAEILSSLATAWNGQAHADCTCHPKLSYRPRHVDDRSYPDGARETETVIEERPADRLNPTAP